MHDNNLRPEGLSVVFNTQQAPVCDLHRLVRQRSSEVIRHPLPVPVPLGQLLGDEVGRLAIGHVDHGGHHPELVFEHELEELADGEGAHVADQVHGELGADDAVRVGAWGRLGDDDLGAGVVKLDPAALAERFLACVFSLNFNVFRLNLMFFASFSFF